jgi:hypothetical protein
MSIGTNENIFRFEIAIDDAGSVKAFDPFDNFRSIEPSTITS